MSSMQPYGNVVEYLAQKGIVCSEQQQKAILSGQNDTLLLAVPGSGKTTVLVSRIAQMLLFEQYAPEQIVALTYNRAAARDIGRRFEALFGELLPETPRFSTVHSLCFQILRRYAALYGRTIPTLLDGSSFALRPQTLLREALAMQTNSFYTAEQLEEILEQIGRCVNRMEKPKKEKLPGNGYQLDRLMADYQRLKQQRRLMDYDDMQLFALRILVRLPEFREKITARWKWIFLDEAQDASLLQHKLIAVLAAGKRVFFVGDEDQTIYDFRGASPGQLLKFPKEHPKCEVLRLETNYRCPKDLVSAADVVIRYNQDRYPKEMKAFRDTGNAICVKALPDANGQVDAVIKALSELPEGSTAAVLAANNVSLLPIARRLSARGIPYYRRDGDYKFSTHPAVRGFVQILQYAADPKNVEDFEATAKLLWFRKADTEQMKQYLHRFPNGFYAGLVCDLSRYEKQHATDAANAFSLMAKQTGAQIFDTVMVSLRYQNYLAGRGRSADELPPGTALAVYQLRAIAEQSKNLSGFLNLLAQIEEFEQQPSPRVRSAITLSTIHGAKGLEFDEVYLLDTLEGCLPSFLDEGASPAQKKENMEQQTRLFYVAVTRAKQKLTLYTSSLYWGKPVKPSRFIGRLSKGKTMTAKRVKHRAFGIGEILSVEGDTVTVAFDRGVRTLQLAYCLENGILQWISPQDAK